MRYLTTLVLLCASIIFSPLFSQGLNLNDFELEKDKKPISNPHQIGLSIGGFRGLIIDYRYEFSKNNILRASYNGGGLSNLLFWQDNNSSYSIDLRLGYERHFPLTKKLSFYLGAEVAYNQYFFEGEASHRFASVEAIAGLKYDVNRRTSVFAEGRYGVHFTGTHNEGNTTWNNSQSPAFHFGVLFRMGKFKNKNTIKKY